MSGLLLGGYLVVEFILVLFRTCFRRHYLVLWCGLIWETLMKSQGLVNVPFWGLVSHHLQTSVGYYIPNSRVMLNWDIYQPLNLKRLDTFATSPTIEMTRRLAPPALQRHRQAMTGRSS